MEYKICKRCIMDTSVKNISFDKNDYCEYCNDFLLRTNNKSINSNSKKNELSEIISKCKENGKGRKYDCLVGISGGVDSSWSLVKAVESGLRPLAVHMDNGWNSELTQNNIYNLVTRLGVDFQTHVIDWQEYKSLMQAFFDADVVDIELLYDNAMIAVNYKYASKYGIKYILSGDNNQTEGFRIPDDWVWHKYDVQNIKDISKGYTDLITFPAISTLKKKYYEKVRGIDWVNFLDYFTYDKHKVIEELMAEYSYKPYPYKHYESIFTRFYQGYILPEKFSIDKRRLHLSNLIAAGQLMREEALRTMNSIAYPSIDDLENDKIYFLKKMDWSEDELKKYINRPSKPHDLYNSELPNLNRMVLFKNKLKNFLSKIFKFKD